MIRTGIGFDAHRFAKGRALVVGGVRIEHEFGLAGHSDADVLAHAVADALLGAVGDGDIGEHFPDTDPKWKDADSLRIVSLVALRLKEKSALILNIDSVIVAESPRMAPYRDRMRANLAGAMGVPVDRVSVKASTVEGMGALGRKEGIAVMAVATVETPGPGDVVCP